METQLLNTCKSAYYEKDCEYGDVIMVNENEWKKFMEKYEKNKTTNKNKKHNSKKKYR